ncbi:MAG TPA: transcriptional regulator [Bacteroidales bacterium]|nr:transcriptional regulator [Bacteroidales bacterium]
MRNKNISTQSNRLLSYFNQREVRCFTYNEAYKAIPDAKQGTVRELLSDMTKRGLLMRLKEGVYHLIPYESDPATFMPDWHLIAKHLVGDANHYIGYYSALQMHNLITQPSLKEQIVVAKQIRPTVINIKNVPFQFIYHNEDHFFGAKSIWVDNFHKATCSDLEKTIIDCLFKPDYAGGIVEIAKAIYQTRNTLRYATLLDYAIRFKSQAVMKRLGFLVETLTIETDIVEQLHARIKPSYVVLDTELPATGKLLSRWQVQVNIDIETIKSAIYS